MFGLINESGGDKHGQPYEMVTNAHSRGSQSAPQGVVEPAIMRDSGCQLGQPWVKRAVPTA
jgi:hypothetical protein